MEINLIIRRSWKEIRPLLRKPQDKSFFYQTPGVSDILLSLTRQDVGAVVTTLMMMDNAPTENISSIWSGNTGF